MTLIAPFVCTDQGRDELGIQSSNIKLFFQFTVHKSTDSPLGKIAVSLEIGYRIGLKFRTDDQPRNNKCL